MRYRELTRKLGSLGCVEVPRTGGGSHRKWRNTINGRSTIAPDWGGKELKVGTVRSVVRQLGLDWERFTAA